eukprot:2853501-Rhodomonas_salina.2
MANCESLADSEGVGCSCAIAVAEHIATRRDSIIQRLRLDWQMCALRSVRRTEPPASSMCSPHAAPGGALCAASKFYTSWVMPFGGRETSRTSYG